MICEDYHARVRQEWDNPSYSVIKFEGSHLDSRLPEHLTAEEWEENRDILRKIHPDVEIRSGWCAMQIAEDIVALLDHSKMPQYYAPINRERIASIETHPLADIYPTVTTISRMNQAEVGQRVDSSLLIRQIETALEKYKSGDSASWLAEVCQYLSEPQIARLFALNNRYLDTGTLIGNKETELYEEAELENERLSNELTAEFYQRVNQLGDEKRRELFSIRMN